MRRIRERLTATAAALTTVIVLIAGEAGVDLSLPLATAIVFLACLAVSLWKPRWAEARGLLVHGHPAALTAAIALVAVNAANLAGVDLDRTTAVEIVGALAVVVGIGTPRAID